VQEYKDASACGIDSALVTRSFASQGLPAAFGRVTKCHFREWPSEPQPFKLGRFIRTKITGIRLNCLINEKTHPKAAPTVTPYPSTPTYPQFFKHFTG